MKKGIFESAHPLTQFILTLFTMLVIFMLLTFIAMLFAPLVCEVSVPDLLEGRMSLGLIRYVQTVQGFTLFIIPALALGYLFGGSPNQYFGFRKSSPKRWFLFVFCIVVTVIPLINLMAALNEKISFPESMAGLEARLHAMEDAAMKVTEQIIYVNSVGWLLFNIFMIAILPAVGEELIFRGVLQRIFVRWTGNVHVGIIITGFLFSAMHLQFFGFFPRWALGIMLGYLFVWSGNIWLPIFAHFTNNALSIIVGYFIYNQHLPKEVETFGSTTSAIPITLGMTAVFAFLFWKFKRESALEMKKINADACLSEN